MNLRSGDTWGYWGLSVAGLILFVAGVVNSMGEYQLVDAMPRPALLAIGAVGVPAASLLVLLRIRR